MRILHISHSDNIGGASIAAYRLHESMVESGVDSNMLVQRKNSNDARVFKGEDLLTQLSYQIRPKLGALQVKQYRHRKAGLFSTNWMGAEHSRFIEKFNPDIIHLHWVAGGWLSYKWLNKNRVPVVWTMHDMWPFTGGCHFAGECQKYTLTCGRCEALGSSKTNDLSTRIQHKKQKYFSDIPITIISPSNWLAECIRASSVFKNQTVEVVPYGINTDFFSPANRQTARHMLELPLHKKIVLVGATDILRDQRKGWKYIPQVLEKFTEEERKEIVLLVFGSEKLEANELLIPGIEIRMLGIISSIEKLRNMYRAADVFVATYLEDNLPNTLIEAIACGVPVVAFNVGGISDIVVNGTSGFLVKQADVSDMSHQLKVLLNNHLTHDSIVQNARAYAIERFSLKTQLNAYKAIYKTVLK